MNCLSGIRVADFAWVAAGTFCALLTRYLGAETIKVESKERLDVTRLIQPRDKPFNVDGSALFNDTNLGKRSITLNLSKPEGIELARKLIGISDVVIENFRPGVMKKLGLDYESIVKFKPDIIMVSYSLSGQTGPESGYLGYAPIAGSLSGLSHLSGYDGPEDLPSPVGGEFDLVTGAAAIIPVIAALYNKQQTGMGQYIDFSAREAGTTFIGEAVLDYEMNKRDQGRSANRDDSMAPHNVYPCKGTDRWISIAIANDDEWGRFCYAVDHRDWFEDPRFGDSYKRWKNQGELDGLIEEWTRDREDMEIMDLLQHAGIAALPSFDASQLSDNSHLKARGMITRSEHPVLGPVDVLGVPWKVSGIRPVMPRAPLMGEDNGYVFKELLGIADDEIARLKDGKIIY
jgi:benzylsuccinate CoA-transferase BbsF subunit